VLNLEGIETVAKVLPLTSEQLAQVVTFADSHFFRLVNRLSTEEIGQLATYLATTTPPLSTSLASDLASGQQTVAGLLNPTAAEATAPTATTPTSGVADLPSVAVIWQFIYANSVVVAFGVVLLAALLLAVISVAGRRRSAAQPTPTKPTQPPKQAKPSNTNVSKRKRKPRDVYDIFHD